MNRKQISLFIISILMAFCCVFIILQYTGKKAIFVNTFQSSNKKVNSDIVSGNFSNTGIVNLEAGNFVKKFPVLTQFENNQLEYFDNQLSYNTKLNIAKLKLSTKLNYLNEYITSTDPNKNIYEFINWLCGKYTREEMIRISSEADINSDFYQLTGKSLFVLCDEFLEINTNINKQTQNSQYVNLLFAGDICLEEDGYVLDYYDTVNNLDECIDSDIIDRTNNADIFMANNEFCYSDRGNPLNGKMYTFRAKPERVKIFQQLGTDIVSLANNHVFDYGTDAFNDTMETLKNQNISYVGGGNNAEEARKPVYYIVNGMKIGYISASMAEKVRYTQEATETQPGIFRMYDYEPLKEIIQKMSGQCDYVIAYLHWGTEDSKYYEQYQHDIAEELIDCGADAIIGGHPHVLQGFEYIKGKPVIYSLGDFWFNNETKYTGMVNLQVDINGLKALDFIPCKQSEFKTTLITDDNELKNIFDYINNLSNACTINEKGAVIQ